MQGRRFSLRRFGSVRSDWANIQKGQKWAKSNAAKACEIAEICSNFAGAGSHLESAAASAQKDSMVGGGAGCIARQQNRNAEGIHLGNLGNAYSDLGEPRKAIEYHEQALKIAREIGDRRGEGAGLGNLGSAYSDLGEPRKAIEYYEQALKIAREIGDRRGEGNHLGNLGWPTPIWASPQGHRILRAGPENIP